MLVHVCLAALVSCFACIVDWHDLVYAMVSSRDQFFYSVQLSVFLCDLGNDYYPLEFCMGDEFLRESGRSQISTGINAFQLHDLRYGG